MAVQFNGAPNSYRRMLYKEIRKRKIFEKQCNNSNLLL